MKLSTAVSVQINSALELGVASMRALMGAEAPVLAPVLAPVAARAVASRPNRARNLTSHATGLDDRLDAIRRAGL